MENWDNIKREYITGTISYRELAKKHGISFSALKHNAISGGWYAQRERYRNNVDTKAIEKAVEKSTEYKSALYDLAYKVANQLTELVCDNDISTLLGLGLKPRDITGAIKDLEDALHVKSAADLREQEARIKKLQKEAAEIDKNRGEEAQGGVLILPSVGEIDGGQAAESKTEEDKES